MYVEGFFHLPAPPAPVSARSCYGEYRARAVGYPPPLWDKWKHQKHRSGSRTPSPFHAVPNPQFRISLEIAGQPEAVRAVRCMIYAGHWPLPDLNG